MKWLKVSPKATVTAMEELLVLVDFSKVGVGAGRKLVTLANQFSSSKVAAVFFDGFLSHIPLDHKFFTVITYFDLLETIKARMSRCCCGGRFDCRVHQLRVGPYKESDVVLKWLQLHWEFAISNDISTLVGFLPRSTIQSEDIPTYLSIPSVRQNGEVVKMLAQMDLSLLPISMLADIEIDVVANIVSTLMTLKDIDHLAEWAKGKEDTEVCDFFSKIFCLLPEDKKSAFVSMMDTEFPKISEFDFVKAWSNDSDRENKESGAVSD